MGWGVRAERGENRTHHAIDVRQDIIVPETHYAKSEASEMVGTHGVDIDAVLTAINFHDQSFFEADKINDVVVDGRLATEASVVELPASQTIPQRAFRVRWVATQPAGNRGGHHWDYPPPQPSPARGEGV